MLPPCRTTLEMREVSMPDSRATMASASSEVWRCWVSKSAGTYSASITGVIGKTLSRRTVPFQVCDSVAAVAIAGFARSESARSSGTRMELNICASVLVINLAQFGHPDRQRLVARSLLQQFRAHEQHQTPAAECHVGPVVDLKVEYGKAGGRQINSERVASGGIATPGKRECQFMHSRIVPDDHQPLWIGGRRVADGFKEL